MDGKTTIAPWIKRLFVVLWIAFIVLPDSGHAKEISHKVAVVTSGNDNIYNDVTTSMTNVIAGERSTIISLSIFDLEHGLPTGDLSDLLASYDLVVSVGLNATKVIIALDQRPPLLATLIPLNAAEALLNPPDSSKARLHQWASAIVLDQPIERQLRLINVITNGIKSIGILLSPTSRLTMDDVESLSKRFHLSIQTEQVNPGDNFIRELGYILDRTDIFLAIPDPVIFNRKTAGVLLESAYRHRVPVIGFALSHVKAGALAAAYSSPEQIGAHTGESIIEYFSKGREVVSIILPPKYFSVSVNRQVARSLGLILPKEPVIEEKIHSLEKTTP